MRHIWWIFRRDLASYFRTRYGFLLIAVALFFDGLLFNGLALGGEPRASGEVLSLFFYYTSGVCLGLSVFVSMRVIAEEKQTGTLILLSTSAVRDYELVVGKFAAAWAFIGVFALATLYMPALILVHGKVSLGHLCTGYLGLMLLSAAALALGLLCSALAPNQLVALVLGAAVVATFVLLWWLARIAGPPLADVLSYLSLHNKHFAPFTRGVVRSGDVVFYCSLTYVALLGATRVLEARRWR